MFGFKILFRNFKKTRKAIMKVPPKKTAKADRKIKTKKSAERISSSAGRKEKALSISIFYRFRAWHFRTAFLIFLYTCRLAKPW